MVSGTYNCGLIGPPLKEDFLVLYVLYTTSHDFLCGLYSGDHGLDLCV